MRKLIYLSLHLRQQSASFGLLKKNICFCCFYRFFPMFMFFHIKISIFISNLVWIGSGIFRNVFKNYFLSLELPQGFFLKNDTFLEFWTWQILKTWLLSYFWSVVAPAGFFFWKIVYFHIFWHDNFPKSVFLVKNSIFGVINYQNIDMFVHILGPLTNGPFIKKLKLLRKHSQV